MRVLTALRLLRPAYMTLISVVVLVLLALLTQSGWPLLAALLYLGWWWALDSAPARAYDPRANETVGIPLLGENALQASFTVDGLVRASQAINEVTSTQAESAREQAQVIIVANARLDDFLALTERITQQARQVTKIANQAAAMSESGQAAIAATITSMDDIRTQVNVIGETIRRLADLTRRIDDIINSVSEIATQSNLLALNASIEAARAGVHGRGFAVVADEVRTLAGQSTHSAEQVRGILSEIQKAMKETIAATQQGMANVEQGLLRTHTTQEVMLQLSASVNDSRHAVQDISQVLQQQAEGMEEIAISMDRIQRITQQSLDSTRTVEMVSGNLSRLANDLVSAVPAIPAPSA